MDNIDLLSILIKLRISDEMVYYLADNRQIIFMHKVFRKIKSIIKIRKKNINIKKMASMKISLLELQEKRKNSNLSSLDEIKKICKQFSIQYIDGENIEIDWNRFSVIDRKFLFKKHLEKNKYQIGNFNWPITLNEIYANLQCVHVWRNIDNAKYASKYVINIPIWMKNEK